MVRPCFCRSHPGPSGLFTEGTPACLPCPQDSQEWRTPRPGSGQGQAAGRRPGQDPSCPRDPPCFAPLATNIGLLAWVGAPLIIRYPCSWASGAPTLQGLQASLGPLGPSPTWTPVPGIHTPWGLVFCHLAGFLKRLHGLVGTAGDKGPGPWVPTQGLCTCWGWEEGASQPGPPCSPSCAAGQALHGVFPDY